MTDINAIQIQVYGREWSLIRHPCSEQTPKKRRETARSTITKLASQPPAASAAEIGGARRDRTDDLLLAKQALSQLSYGPGREHAGLPFRKTCA